MPRERESFGSARFVAHREPGRTLERDGSTGRPRPGEASSRGNSRAVRSLGPLGTVSCRASMGHGPRGLLAGRLACGRTFPHDHARSRAYRWGEDGLLGICDDGGRLCFALALWNGADPILKERLFGLTGPEGNHGEDVKELYCYLDATPSHAYLKALYRYPQRGIPVRATSSPRTLAGPRRPRVRAGRHRHLRRRPLLRRRRRVRQGRRRTTS